MSLKGRGTAGLFRTTPPEKLSVSHKKAYAGDGLPKNREERRALAKIEKLKRRKHK